MEFIKKWVWILGLGFSLLFTLGQFQIAALRDLVNIEYQWLYGQAYTEAYITPNLAAREAKGRTDEIVAIIYKLESSGGKFDPCVRDNLGYNGFGYAPGNCYSNHEQVRGYVAKWVQNKLDQGMTVAQTLCYYNLGKPNGQLLNNCEYYQNYVRLQS